MQSKLIRIRKLIELSGMEDSLSDIMEIINEPDDDLCTPILPQNIHIVVYEHTEGVDVTAHLTSELADQTITQIMKDNQKEIVDLEDQEFERGDDGEIDFSKVEPHEWGNLSGDREYLSVYTSPLIQPDNVPPTPEISDFLDTVSNHLNRPSTPVPVAEAFNKIYSHIFPDKNTVCDAPLLYEDGATYNLKYGYESAWVNVNDLAVYIKKTDEGVVVDIFPKHDVDSDSIASTYAHSYEALCQYCGTRCFEGDGCDEWQAGGFEKNLERRYLQSRGSVCPVCESKEIEAGKSDFEGDTVTSHVMCNNCDAEWTDTYTLNQVEITDQGNKEGVK